MSFNVFYSEKARDDLIDIYTYIAFSLKELMTAERIYNEIISAVHTLGAFPLRNALSEQEPWRGRGLRRLSVKNFLVLYTVDEETRTVNVIRIMYGARDIENHLNEG